jgi:Tol biopolymer transport system component
MENKALRVFALVTLVSVGIYMLFSVNNAKAQTWQVNRYDTSATSFADVVINPSDPSVGVGTLRHAVYFAQPGDTIVFTGSSLPLNQITLSEGQITINKNLTIKGPGANNLTIRKKPNASPPLDSDKFRAFEIVDAEVTISGLTIKQFEAIGAGGAILVQGDNVLLNLISMVFATNEAAYRTDISFADDGFGGAVASIMPGSVTFPKNRVNIAYTTFTSNSAYRNGGAVSNSGSVGITDSRFVNNIILDRLGQGSENGLYYNGGAIYSSATDGIGVAAVSESLFDNNRTERGGAAYVYLGNLVIANSTFVNNIATEGGGSAIYHAGMDARSSTTIQSSTFQYNGTRQGKTTGTIFHGGSAHLSLKNNIISVSNITERVPSDVAAPYEYDRIVGPAGNGANCASDLISTPPWEGAFNAEYNNTSNLSLSCLNSPSSVAIDPRLFPNSILATQIPGSGPTPTPIRFFPVDNNGGSTETIALRADSPIKNTGDADLCSTGPARNIDQRGVTRVLRNALSSTCSIGAYQPIVSRTGQVVYSRYISSTNQYDLEVIDSATGTARKLTNGVNTSENDPQSSPDGEKVAYTVSIQTGGVSDSEIWLINSDDTTGGTARQLTNTSELNFEPRWSPNGRWIAYRSSNGTNGRIWLMSADGSDKYLVMGATNLAASNITWMPDGRTILFAGTQSGISYLHKVTIDFSSTPPTFSAPEKLIIRDGTTTVDVAIVGPIFASYAGTDVLFSYAQAGSGGTTVTITQYDVSSGQKRDILPLESNIRRYAKGWSPNQRQIFFSVGTLGSGPLNVVDAEGRNLRGVTTTSTITENLSAFPWSVDELWFAFTGSNEVINFTNQIFSPINGYPRGSTLFDGQWLKIKSALAAPNIPLPQQPQGVMPPSVNGLFPRYEWGRESGDAATAYDIHLYDLVTNQLKYVQRYTKNESCWATPCTARPYPPLVPSSQLKYNRNYGWTLQGLNAAGLGPTTDWMVFAIASQGGTANAIQPVGDVTSGNLRPTYQWEMPDPYAVQFAIYTYDMVPQPDVLVYEKVVDSINVCTVSGLCTFTHDGTPLVNGKLYGWFVVGIGYGGPGPASDGKAFYIYGSAPATPTTTAPTGLLSNANVTFTWPRDIAARLYYLEIKNAAGEVKHGEWYDASFESEACNYSPGVCTVQVTLGNGTYQWRIAAWNPLGYSPWSESKTFDVFLPLVREAVPTQKPAPTFRPPNR